METRSIVSGELNVASFSSSLRRWTGCVRRASTLRRKTLAFPSDFARPWCRQRHCESWAVWAGHPSISPAKEKGLFETGSLCHHPVFQWFIGFHFPSHPRSSGASDSGDHTSFTWVLELNADAHARTALHTEPFLQPKRKKKVRGIVWVKEWEAGR